MFSLLITIRNDRAPYLKKMQGEAKPHEPLFINATITTPLKRRAGRRDFQRATMAKNVQSEWEVTPFKSQSSGVMTSITSANCLMIVPEEVSELKEGDTVQVMPLHF